MLGGLEEFGLFSSLKQYISSIWNQLACLSMLLYFIGTQLFNFHPKRWKLPFPVDTQGSISKVYFECIFYLNLVLINLYEEIVADAYRLRVPEF